MPSPEPKTILQSLRQNSLRHPRSAAIKSPTRSDLNFRQLIDQIELTRNRLAQFGIKSTDRVALVLPNSSEMATAFLGISSSCACAPLNPKFSPEQIDLRLSELGARAIVLPKGSTLGSDLKSKCPRIYLTPSDNDASGMFSLAGDLPHNPITPSDPTPEQIALILHTAGTTSTSKMVPLTHRNICTSGKNIRLAYRLGASDCRLNIMPLFHVQGLIGAVFSSLAAGGTCYCAPGFDPDRFFNWIDDSQCTWFSAVPLMYYHILDEAPKHRDLINNSKLRFVRVGSYALPREEMLKVEDVFGVPAIESYGMTEAASQISVNPIDGRRLGSVGTVQGPELKIINKDWEDLPKGEVGEICIRGANVTPGYLDNENVNRSSFRNGWLRTGDLGRFDENDYLYLVGRIKEMINRAGEKIAPREIDEALNQHRAVGQAVAFPVPDKRLGQKIYAAIRFHRNRRTDQAELRKFLSQRIPHFKIPERFIFVQEIPKGPTGKVKRLQLANQLGVDDVASSSDDIQEYVEPHNEAERVLVEVASKLLGVTKLSVLDNFLTNGGDSLLTIRYRSLCRSRGYDFEPESVLRATTFRELAKMSKPSIRSKRTPIEDGQVPLLPAQRSQIIYQFGSPYPDYWCVSPLILRINQPISDDLVRRAMMVLVDHHQALSLRIQKNSDVYRQFFIRAHDVDIPKLDLDLVPQAHQRASFHDFVESMFRELDICNGSPWKIGRVEYNKDSYLIFVSNHLMVDGYSNVIVGDHLNHLCTQGLEGNEMCIADSTYYTDFASKLSDLAKNNGEHGNATEFSEWPSYDMNGPLTVESLEELVISLSSGESDRLSEFLREKDSRIDIALMAALRETSRSCCDDSNPAISYVTSGRTQVPGNIDLSQMVGCIAFHIPVTLVKPNGETVNQLLKETDQHLSRALAGSYSWLLRRFRNIDSLSEAVPALPRLLLNFKSHRRSAPLTGNNGAVIQRVQGGILEQYMPLRYHPRNLPSNPIYLICGPREGKLQMQWSFSRNRYYRETIESLGNEIASYLVSWPTT